MASNLQGLGPFRLMRVIAEGERATVYKAIREGGAGVPLPVALEVLHPHVVHDADEATAFQERATVARRLAHRAIVALLDDGVTDGRPWASWELVDGVSLDALYPKRGRARLKVEAAAWVLRGVLAALAAARETRAGIEGGVIVHGRLDAGAVLLDGDGDVRVTGFGTVGEPETDLLAVARLAQEMTDAWPAEIDAWLDRCQDGDQSFADADEALAAFPLDPGADGAAAVARLAKRLIKKREREEAAEGGGEAAQEAGDSPAMAKPARAPRPPRRSGTVRVQRPREAPGPEVGEAARQARLVAWVCGAVLLGALAFEVLRFSV